MLLLSYFKKHQRCLVVSIEDAVTRIHILTYVCGPRFWQAYENSWSMYIFKTRCWLSYL